MIAVSWVLGPNLIMSESCPNAGMPRLAAVSTAAALSVCCMMTSAPWSISALAASASFPGLIHSPARLRCTVGGVEPFADLDDLDLDVGVDRLRAQQGGVEAGDPLRDRHRADVPHHARLGHLGRDHALNVAALVEAARIGRQVLFTLVAG